MLLHRSRCGSAIPRSWLTGGRLTWRRRRFLLHPALSNICFTGTSVGERGGLVLEATESWAASFCIACSWSGGLARGGLSGRGGRLFLYPGVCSIGLARPGFSGRSRLLLEVKHLPAGLGNTTITSTEESSAWPALAASPIGSLVGTADVLFGRVVEASTGAKAIAKAGGPTATTKCAADTTGELGLLRVFLSWCGGERHVIRVKDGVLGRLWSGSGWFVRATWLGGQCTAARTRGLLVAGRWLHERVEGDGSALHFPRLLLA
jgi:hypothetical protein